MRIVVIADTHVKRPGNWLPPGMEKVLREADIIVHCGDLVALCVYEDLSRMGRVVAVHGNMDYPEVREKLPGKAFFEAGGYRFGVIHGSGSPLGIEKRVAAELPEADVIIYGHTHCPRNEFKDGVLFFNPGSLLDRRFAPFKSYGVLEVGPEGVKGEIIRLP